MGWRQPTNDLTSARNQAQKDAAENLQLAQAAVTARQYSQSLVADMQTERGMLSAEQGDSAGAMLWFTTAATQTPHDAQRQAANRLRARNAMNQTVMPVASLRLTKPGMVTRLAFQPCPDCIAELLLTVVVGRVEIWNWRTEQVLPWTSHADSFTDACWLPDGRHVAIGRMNGEVQVRSVPAGDVIQTFQSKGSVESLACSADGQRLAVSGDVVQVWNISKGSQKPVLEHELAHPQKVHSLIFNHIGDRLATSCRDNLVRVFAIGGSTDQPVPLFDPVAHIRDVGIGIETSPVFQSDRVLVIVASKPGGGSLIVSIDASSGAAINGRPQLPVSSVGRLVVSHDGQCLATATAGTCEMSSSQGERITLKHPHQVHDVAFGPDGALLTACFDWHAYLRTSPGDQATPTKIPQLRPVERCWFSGLTMDAASTSSLTQIGLGAIRFTPALRE